MYRLNLKFRIFSELLVNDYGEINHLAMYRINLKFRIFSELLFGWQWGINHLSMSKVNFKFKIFSELLVGNIAGVNHLSMSRINHEFKIFRGLLVSDNGGKSSFHVQAKSWIWNFQSATGQWQWQVNHLSMYRINLKFKIFSVLLVSNSWGQINFSCTG